MGSLNMVHDFGFVSAMVVVLGLLPPSAAAENAQVNVETQRTLADIIRREGFPCNALDESSAPFRGAVGTVYSVRCDQRHDYRVAVSPSGRSQSVLSIMPFGLAPSYYREPALR
jgi:hypothetical protein